MSVNIRLTTPIQIAYRCPNPGLFERQVPTETFVPPVFGKEKIQGG